jgi:hypothetical protein
MLLACALLGACGGKKDPAVCRREAAELGTLLSTMDHEMPSFFAGDIELVRRNDVPPVVRSFAPMATITATDGALFFGDPLDSVGAADRVMDELRRLRERAAGANQTVDTEIYLVIAEDAPWQHVASALNVLQELKVRRVAFAFERPPVAVEKPPRGKLDDELDRIQSSEDASNKAVELARIVEKQVKGCPAIQEVFGAVAADDGTSKADTVIRGIEPSLVKCNCNVDMASFRSVMFRLLYIEKPQSSFTVTLDRAGEPIEAAPELPWREAHAQFVPEAKVWVTRP